MHNFRDVRQNVILNYYLVHAFIGLYTNVGLSLVDSTFKNSFNKKSKRKKAVGL